MSNKVRVRWFERQNRKVFRS